MKKSKKLENAIKICYQASVITALMRGVKLSEDNTIYWINQYRTMSLERQNWVLEEHERVDRELIEKGVDYGGNPCSPENIAMAKAIKPLDYDYVKNRINSGDIPCSAIC